MMFAGPTPEERAEMERRAREEQVGHLAAQGAG